jgi:hypothetical protein
MDQPARDGFEGIGIFVYYLAALLATLLILPAIALTRKLVLDARHKPMARGRWIWLSPAAYAVSMLAALRFIPLSFTDHEVQIVLYDCVGTCATLVALVFSFCSRGPGRWWMIVSASALSLVWIPFFLGRVLRLL